MQLVRLQKIKKKKEGKKTFGRLSGVLSDNAGLSLHRSQKQGRLALLRKIIKRTVVLSVCAGTSGVSARRDAGKTAMMLLG